MPPPPSPILVADKSGREVKPKIIIEVPESMIVEAVAEALIEETKPEPAQEKPPANRKTKTRSSTDG